MNQRSILSLLHTQQTMTTQTWFCRVGLARANQNPFIQMQLFYFINEKIKCLIINQTLFQSPHLLKKITLRAQ